MQLKLVRTVLKNNRTEGILYVNDEFFCYTVEDKVRSPLGKAWNKLVKVYAQTAIPYGTYPVLVTWSNRFKRMLTGVFNVPSFEGIRIHNGVSELSSAGCIIVSYVRNPDGTLENSRGAMNKLCEIVSEAQTKEKVLLTITNI